MLIVLLNRLAAPSAEDKAVLALVDYPVKVLAIH
jgi:hypothetical protein